MPTTSELITTSEAAKLNQCGVRTVHRMVADGRLVAALRLPGKTGALLFRRADVLALKGAS